jgi:ABC-type transport system involved in multi-copper enzyme maturation permease subunit
MRLLRSSLDKLLRRPATSRVFLVLVAFLVLMYLSLGLTARASPGQASVLKMLAFPDAQAGLAAMLLIFAGMAGAAYAGAAAASEWSWNTFRLALTRGESRVRYVLSLWLAIALLLAVAWVVLYVLGVALIVAAASLGGVQGADPFGGGNLGSLVAMMVGGAWAVLMEVAIGFAVAFVARSAVAGIAAVVGLFFLERFAEMFVPADLLQFAPISAAENLIAAAGKSWAALGLALVVTTAYLLVAVAAAGAVARRSDVA